MTITEKREIAEKIKELLSRLISDDEPQENHCESKTLEMLTIKECAKAVKRHFGTYYSTACSAEQDPVHSDGTGQARENTYQ